MCDHVPLSPSALSGMDFSRRGFLRTAGAGALTVAISGGLSGHAHAAEAHIKSVHGSGFCNLNYFLTEAKQLAKDDGVILDFVVTPIAAEMVTFLGAGQVDAALIPYTSFIALYDKGAPVKIVGGGGIQGCVLVAQPGLDSPEKLKGKTLGTFQMDTLEVLPYDWLKKQRRQLPRHQCALHGQHARGGRSLQGRRPRHDLHDRAVRHRAAERRQGQRDAVRRHRHLRQGLHRLRAGRPQPS